MLNDFNQNNLMGGPQTGMGFPMYPFLAFPLDGEALDGERPDGERREGEGRDGERLEETVFRAVDANGVFNYLIKSQEAMVEAYARTIGDVKSDELKDILRTAQESHFKKMMVLSDRLYEIGGNPDFHVGLRGALDDLKHRLDRKNDITDLEIARFALKSEILNLEKLSANDREGLDPTSRELFGAAAHFNEENIRLLEEYIKKEEARLH